MAPFARVPMIEAGQRESTSDRWTYKLSYTGALLECSVVSLSCALLGDKQSIPCLPAN